MSYASNYVLSSILKDILTFFGTFSHKVVQTWFVWHRKWYTILFDIYNGAEMVRVENISHILEITC